MLEVGCSVLLANLNKGDVLSLDVYLIIKKPACEHCGTEESETVVFDANITHNLNKMAMEAGIYEYLWRPEEIDVYLAGDIIEPVKIALADMKARPAYYQQWDSPNGWGLYKNFVPWIERYLEACIAHPEATIYVSR